MHVIGHFTMYAYTGLRNSVTIVKQNIMVWGICLELGDMKFIWNFGQELSWNAATVALRRR
jgi:hypothetical protein